MDLDTRPPQMERATLLVCVQRCPDCGYCAFDVSVFAEKSRSILESPGYQAQLKDSSIPELASSFICAGLLYEEAEQLAESGWSFLRAAWVFDDADLVEQSQIWRSRAADLFIRSMDAAAPIIEQDGASEIVLAECLRRSGRDLDALRIIQRAKTQNPPEIFRRVLEFQLKLVQAGDLKVHTLAEVLA